jgi:hypothetical protein
MSVYRLQKVHLFHGQPRVVRINRLSASSTGLMGPISKGIELIYPPGVSGFLYRK